MPSNPSEQIFTLFSIYDVSFLLTLTFVDWHLPLRLVYYAQEGSKKYGPQTSVCKLTQQALGCPENRKKHLFLYFHNKAFALRQSYSSRSLFGFFIFFFFLRNQNKKFLMRVWRKMAEALQVIEESTFQLSGAAGEKI